MREIYGFVAPRADTRDARGRSPTRRHARALAALVWAAALGPARAPAQTIDTGTPPAADGGAIVMGYASPSLATSVAQTFVAPADARVLTGFQFWLRDATSFAGTPFRAYVYPWSDATERVSGAPLWTSDVMVGTAAATPVPYAFATGGITLRPELRYAVVLSSLGAPPLVGGTAEGGVMAALFGLDRYAAGRGFAASTLVADGLPGLAGVTWTGYTDGVDHAFTATFAALTIVPEPPPIALVVAGLAGLALCVATVRRRSTP